MHVLFGPVYLFNGISNTYGVFDPLVTKFLFLSFEYAKLWFEYNVLSVKMKFVLNTSKLLGMKGLLPKFDSFINVWL